MQTYVDDRSDRVVAITRENPGDHNRFVLVAHCAIAGGGGDHLPPPITLQGPPPPP